MSGLPKPSPKSWVVLGFVGVLGAGAGVLWRSRGEPLPEEKPVAPTPVLDAPAPAADTVWTVDNVHTLRPAAPTRNGAVSQPVPANPAYDEALVTLGKVVEHRDGDPGNAWAMAHGLLARGTEFRLTNELLALPYLFSVYAEPRPVGALTLVGFPEQQGEALVEPHTDLILKNLSEIGVLPTESYPMGAGQVAVADLYRYTVLKTWMRPKENKSNFRDPNDMAWGVQALAAWAPEPNLRWVAIDGTAMDLDQLTDFLVVVLTKESKFMIEAMKSGQPFERKGQPLFSYTCGGAHLLQGASFAVARGFGRPEDRKAIEVQVPLAFYRLPTELRIYDEAMRQQSRYADKLLVQRMKFLGHWLESVSKLQILGFFTPSAEQLRTIEGASQNLTLTVAELKKRGVFDKLDAIQKSDPQLYLDIIGDSAHAVRGLELALGRQTMAW